MNQSKSNPLAGMWGIEPPKTKHNLCANCPEPGCCCYFASIIQGLQIKTDEACHFLNEKTGRCTIYSERHRNPDCLTIEKMIELGTVPKWCPYVKDDPEYQARTDTRLYKFQIQPFTYKIPRRIEEKEKR